MYNNQYPNQQQGYSQQQMYPEQGQLPKKKSTVGLMLGLSSLVIILLVISAVLLIIYGWVLITPKIDAEYFADHNWLEKESESYLVPTNSGTFKYYKDKDVDDDYYYSGSFEFYCGEEAMDYVCNDLKDYGITRYDIDEMIDGHRDEGNRENRFVCLVLHNESCIIEGEEVFTDTVTTPYYGFYREDPYDEVLEVVNMNEGTSYYFLLEEN